MFILMGHAFNCRAHDAGVARHCLRAQHGFDSLSPGISFILQLFRSVIALTLRV